MYYDLWRLATLFNEDHIRIDIATGYPKVIFYYDDFMKYINISNELEPNCSLEEFKKKTHRYSLY